MAAEGSQVTEGWPKWQIALAVGTPVVLGVAGIWLLKRNKSSKSKGDEDQPNKIDEVDAETSRTIQVSIYYAVLFLWAQTCFAGYYAALYANWEGKSWFAMDGREFPWFAFRRRVQRRVNLTLPNYLFPTMQ